MQARAHWNRWTLGARLTLAGTFLAAGLAACGGYGGNSYSMGGGTASCGMGYANACPPPAVSITAPTAGMTVSGTVALTATATASATYMLTIASVQFFDGTTSVGTATTPASPNTYTVNWNAAAATNGSHTLTAKATDSKGDSTTSAAVMVTVTGGVFAAAMAPAQIFPAPGSKASGMARISVDSETGAVSGTVALSGFTARAVTVNQGFAGSTGAALIALEPGAAGGAGWRVPAGALLTAEQRVALTQGRLYVIATSAAHPAGEVRGQLAPENIQVTFSELSATPEAAALGGAASGVAATTVDTRAGTLTVNVNSSGVEAATSAVLDTGAAGATRLALTRDPADVNHWSKELARIGAGDLEALQSGKGSASVASQAAPGGAISGQIRQ